MIVYPTRISALKKIVDLFHKVKKGARENKEVVSFRCTHKSFVNKPGSKPVEIRFLWTDGYPRRLCIIEWDVHWGTQKASDPSPRPFVHPSAFCIDTVASTLLLHSWYHRTILSWAPWYSTRYSTLLVLLSLFISLIVETSCDFSRFTGLSPATYNATNPHLGLRQNIHPGWIRSSMKRRRKLLLY